MINAGGWLLLTIIFSSALFLVQRTEPKRRVITFLLLLGVWGIAWGYGVYRMSNECNEAVRGVCYLLQGHAVAVAWRTTNVAAVTALLVNFLFWFLIGRYNPPRSSDDIKVLGLND